jgi:hypothetical protein
MLRAVGSSRKFAAPEEAEHAAAHPLLQPLDVPGAGLARFVEVDRAIWICREEAVEDDQVEVEVGIERRAEAVQEGDGAELGVGELPNTRGEKVLERPDPGHYGH